MFVRLSRLFLHQGQQFVIFKYRHIETFKNKHKECTEFLYMLCQYNIEIVGQNFLFEDKLSVTADYMKISHHDDHE